MVTRSRSEVEEAPYQRQLSLAPTHDSDTTISVTITATTTQLIGRVRQGWLWLRVNFITRAFFTPHLFPILIDAHHFGFEGSQRFEESSLYVTYAK